MRIAGSGAVGVKAPKTHEDGKGVPLSRHQKKNLSCRHHDSATENQNGLSAVNMCKSKARSWWSANSGYMNRNRENVISAPILRMHAKLNLTNRILSVFLRYYILSPDKLLHLGGYPVKSPYVLDMQLSTKIPLFSHTSSCALLPRTLTSMLRSSCLYMPRKICKRNHTE